jgi:tetratricopeptide (TPR) repeat protein
VLGLGWWREWRERRSTLRELGISQRADEAVLMDQDQNPINLAKLSLDRGDTVTATAHWGRACDLVPNFVLTSNDSLDILLGLKRYDEAETLMHRRRNEISGDRFWLSGLARIAEQRGDFPEALRRWEAARDRTRDQPDAYIGCARCLFELARLDEAESQLESALRRSSDRFMPSLWLARVSDRRKDWTKSVARWTFLAEAYKYPPAFAFRAKALIELGRLDEAEAYLEEPSRLYPRDLEIAVTRAHLAQRRDYPVATCDRWAAVRRMDPFFLAGYHEGARCLVEADRHAEADAVLRSAIELFPDQAWPLRDFARQAHDRKDWDEAAARWEALRKRFPDEEAGYSLGAEALKAAGRGDDETSPHRGS